MSSITATNKIQVWPLPGGIHPPENKAQSLRGPIRQAALPVQLIVPISQPRYAKPELCVQVGEHVQKGQVLARGSLTLGITSHAPAAGTVTAIIEHAVPNASALPELCVVINTDASDQQWHKLPALDYRSTDTDTLIDRIADAGISGLGGAGFPTHAKLRTAMEKVDTVLLNAAECEPFITADDALLRERAADVITGCLILLQLTQAERCLIGIEDNKPQAITALQQHCIDPRLQVVVIPTQYPSGAAKQLIYILTGTEIPSGSLSVDSGILCHNVGTAYAITRAVVHGEALVSRVTTVTGAALTEPANYDVLIGTPISELLQQSGLQRSSLQPEKLAQLICGGPLMGLTLPHAALPITKTTNCLIATTRQELPPPPPMQACIRCGFCADVCPVKLLPQQLYWFARSGELEKAKAHNLKDCIECGACAYVCPSHIPLVQYYRAAKADIADERDKQRRAEYSKQRFDAHEQRKAEEKAVEEQRRAQRALLAKQQKVEVTTTEGSATPTDSLPTGALATASSQTVASLAAATSPAPVSAAPATSSAQDAIAAALARVQAKKAAQQALAKQSLANANAADNVASTTTDSQESQP
jgi:Na+-translocating ferredoxin:NAD+ oxidoreductase subunit C